MADRHLSRRQLLGAVAAGAASSLLRPLSLWPQEGPIARAIPSSGEQLPVIGLGTWITFNVGDDRELRGECTEVMRAFFAAGGRIIDSSPMYGSSQAIEESRRFWGIRRFDLLQIHNLLSWETHLRTLLAMKKEGRVRYVGITTSEGRRHDEIERIMATQPIDFVQITYNILDREVEHRILPLARDRGIGVIVNRPFRQGDLIRSVERHQLPSWAGEIGAVNWAQFLLKFIVSHPNVTCAIPATSQPAHVKENMGAAVGALPDAAFRRRMVTHVESL